MRKRPSETGGVISVLDNHVKGAFKVRRYLAAFLLYPALLLVLLPLFQASIVEAASAQTISPITEQTYTSDDPANIAGSASADPSILLQNNGDLQTLSKAVGMLDATMSGYRRLNINAVDKAQFDSYLAINKDIDLLKTTVPGLVDDRGNVDVSKLPASYKSQRGLGNLSSYSRSLIASILNEVTPKAAGGAGHEFANVFRITKDFRNKKSATSDESIPPFGDEPRESEHAKENGAAVDVNQLDNLRGTKFTIETTVDAKTGKPIIKNGKPDEKVIKYEHIGVQPIDFSLQDKASAGVFPGALPPMYGATPHGGAQQLAGKQLGSVLNQEIQKRGDLGFDTSKVDLTTAQNLGQVAQLYGGAAIGQGMGDIGIALGPNAPLWTGQTSLSQATGLPSFGFYGQSLDGAPNGQTGLLVNMGREVVGQKLSLPQGALIGSTSDDIFTNVGERTFEVALSDLPLGTLDGVANGDRRSLEVHVGRGVLAKQLDLYNSQLPLGASAADFAHALGFQLTALKSAPLAYDTAFGIRDSNGTQQLVDGTLNPDDYLQKLGAARLAMLEAYLPNRADAALNLEERPNLVTGLEDLPASTDPGTSSLLPLNAAEATAARDRASFLLDHFSFAQGPSALLDRAKNGDTATELRFILNHDELQAWLLDNAYVKGYDANQPTKVSRFLAADTKVFYEVGTDQVAKAVAKENDQRTAMRSYFRTGVMPTLDDKVTPVVNIDNLVGQFGFRSRTDFEAVFRANAPLPAFEMTGRRSLLASFGQNETDLIYQVVAPTGSSEEIAARLSTLKITTSNLQAVTTGDVKNALTQSIAVIDQLSTDVKKATSVGSGATPPSWTSSLTNLYQTAQLAAGVADQHPTEYRAYALALGNLANGDTSQSLYSLGDNISLNHPAGLGGLADIAGMLGGQIAPNTALQSFGNAVISQANGLDASTSRGLYDTLRATTSQKNATLTDIRTAINTFANNHSAELAEAASVLNLQQYGYDANGEPVKTDDDPTARERRAAEAMAVLMAQGNGSPTSMKIGSNALDTAFGIQGYQVSPNGSGIWGMLSTTLGASVDQTLQRAIGDQKVWELLTGLPNADLRLDEQQGRMMGAASAQYALNLLGADGIFNRRMITDPNYAFTMDEAVNILQSPLFGGQSLNQTIQNLNIPIVGDFIADRNTLRSVISGQIFNGSSDFWKNQNYIPAINQYAAQAGIPASLIPTLFDRTLTGDQRTEKLGGVFTDYVRAQVTPDRINELFGFNGTGFEAVGQGALSAINILTNPNIADKGSAIQTLGEQIGSNYFAANFGGFNPSFIFNDKTSSTEKINTGLGMLTQAAGLDPAIGGLAQTFYRDFFTGRGIDTSTAQGRTDLATLVNSTAAAAHLPPEFAVLAGAAINGNIQDSLVTLAGQNFIDNQLAANGITNVHFSDMYHAFIGPSTATTQLASATAWNEIVGSRDTGSLGGSGGLVSVQNPTTGETVQVPSSVATALGDRSSALIATSQTAAQANIQYALGDSLLNQALGSQAGSAINASGMTRAMLTGSLDQQATALTGVMAQLAGSSQAGQIFGTIGTARELASFFSSSSPSATLSPGSLAQVENWFSSATGIPAPAGSMSALLNFARTGDSAAFSNLANPSSLVASLGGFLDQGLGLPSGTTQLAYNAFNILSTGANPAGLISLGINQLFGGQIAAVDGALGLPSGTTSMLVTAGITALFVPGATFAVLASSVFLPALAGMLIGSLLSGGGLGSLFGGGTKKIIRMETLWSYRTSDPSQRKAVQTKAKGTDKDTIKQYDGKELPEVDDETQKSLRGAYLKPATQLDRGDWPEEAWFIDTDKPGDTPEKANIIAPGRNVALLTDKQLPSDIFRGNTQQQFLENSRLGAKTKIRQLLNDLLTINTRIFTLDSNGKRVDDPLVFPAEIWTHSQQDVQSQEALINTVYGQGKVGTYQDWIKNYRRGVGFDKSMSLLVRWVHWQY